MAKSLVHAMWLMTLTLKNSGVISTLEAPGWHNPPGLSPYPLFPVPCLFLHGLLLSPTPNAQLYWCSGPLWERLGVGIQGPLFSSLPFQFAGIFSLFRDLLLPQRIAAATRENHQPKAAGRPQVSDLLLRGRSPP